MDKEEACELERELDVNTLTKQERGERGVNDIIILSFQF